MAQVEVQDDVEFVLKHRIVGAVILILFAVFVLPFVLRGQDVNGTSEPATIRTLNDPDPIEFISKVTPVDADSVAKVDVSGDEPTVDLPSSTNDAPKSIDLNTRAEPAPDVSNDTDDAAKKPTVTKEKKVASVERGWVVQVATFAGAENAKKMQDKLKEKGFTVNTSKVDTANGQATRVWVGPFEQRVSAGRARTKIEQAVGQKGLIMAYP